MSTFENFITEGHEKAEEPANEGSMMNGGVLAQVRASRVQQTSEEVEANVHCLVEDWRDCAEFKPKPKVTWTFASKQGEAKKHRTEWCAAAHT